VSSSAARLQMEQSTATKNADLWADVQPDASRRMLVAAVEAFAIHGYSAATTRQIAEHSGLSPAAVYVHYNSKAELLYEISLIGTRSALRAVEHALAGLGAPADRLRAFVEAFVAWHARNHTLARVIQYELKALPAERFDEVDRVRQRIERLLRTELRRGAASGDFEIDDQRSTAMAILSLAIDVARWYQPRALAPDTLGSRYADLALRMVASRDLQRA
jgi:AcrR family transcriptional regulator